MGLYGGKNSRNKLEWAGSDIFLRGVGKWGTIPTILYFVNISAIYKRSERNESILEIPNQITIVGMFILYIISIVIWLGISNYASISSWDFIAGGFVDDGLNN